MRNLFLFAFMLVASVAQSQVVIENRTVHEDAYEIAEIIAKNILDIDTLTLIIIDLPKSSTLLGAVVKNKVEPHAYVMLLNSTLSVKALRLTMSHEFVHIKQYEDEGLEIFGDIWAWNPDNRKPKQGETWGSMTFTGYEAREFELDAQRREIIVNKKLLKIIKSNK